MPFVLKKFPAIKGKKIQQFLLNEVGLTMSSSQKLLAKKRNVSYFNSEVDKIVEDTEILEARIQIINKRKG